MTRLVLLFTVLWLFVPAPAVHLARAAETAASEVTPPGPTPPRLSFVDGQVSFWRPGAQEWVAARVNTPLAPGDELATGSPGTLEVQVGARAWVRAWAGTHVGLAALEPDYLQLKVTTGHVSVDIRRLEPGHSVEVATPHAAFTIERPGYYRVTVAERRTSFVTRRGGRATVIPAGAAAAAVAPSEQVVVEGTEAPQVATYGAPPLDAWDRWNYTRTDQLLESVSARYVPEGVYGIDDLDHHGTWRIVDPYGPVWVPAHVPPGWVPYSTGSWIWDPYYGWTWVDTAPWGWAPFHYGRWVFLAGVWAWAPGPLVVRPVYAPALVVFLAPRPGVQIGVVAGPLVGWVALGWGEPLIPWWGPPGFVGVPWWAGWAGPRVVNKVVIAKTTVVHVHEITVYQNVQVRHAVVAVAREHFGRGPLDRAHLVRVDADRLVPATVAVELKPSSASLVPHAVRGVRPPEAVLHRPVVATRPPDDPGRWLERHGLAVQRPAPAPRLVPAPREREEAAPRPPFGRSPLARPKPERPHLPAPPPAVTAPPSPAPPRGQPTTPPARGPERGERDRPGRGGEAIGAVPTEPRSLPGEPADRLFPERLEGPRGLRLEAPGERRSAPGPGGHRRGEPGRGRRIEEVR
jgi:hypothetical protein